jgi:hypothetical protein
MTCRWARRGGVELCYYGELDDRAEAAFRAHLDRCETCRTALAELEAIGRALPRRVEHAPPHGDWGPFMARLARRMAQEDDWRVARRPRAWLATLAASVALAAAGLAAGLGLRAWWAGRTPLVVSRRPPVVVAPDAAAASAAADVTPAALSHLERTKVVVLGLAAMDAARVRPDDWRAARRRASALLADTAQYRLVAAEQNRRVLADILGDLETVLLEAALGDEADRASVARIQRLVDRRDLLARIDMVTAGEPTRPPR